MAACIRISNVEKNDVGGSLPHCPQRWYVGRGERGCTSFSASTFHLLENSKEDFKVGYTACLLTVLPVGVLMSARHAVEQERWVFSTADPAIKLDHPWVVNLLTRSETRWIKFGSSIETESAKEILKANVLTAGWPMSPSNGERKVRTPYSDWHGNHT